MSQSGFVSVPALELNRLRECEALMAAVMSVIDAAGDVDFIFSEVDWAHAGVDRARAEAIWGAKKIERVAFMRELEERRLRAEQRAALIAMMTPEQLDLLGVTP